jgi:uncharacterized protein YegP (UPF0339 family)
MRAPTPAAEIGMDFRIYRDEAGEWRWFLAEDGMPCLASRTGFSTESACRQSVAALRQRVLTAGTVRVGGGLATLFAQG